MKRLVSTVRFCPSAPYPIQNISKTQLHSVSSKNHDFSTFQPISPEWLSKTNLRKLVPEAHRQPCFPHEQPRFKPRFIFSVLTLPVAPLLLHSVP